MSTIYDKAFFENQQKDSLQSAREIVPLVLEWIKPKSVVDVGCGVGTWLSVFKANGVEEILGIDGDYVERKMLFIPEASFVPSDLTCPLQVSRRFDLVVSVEVAEHLPPRSAEVFVKSLVSLGDVVMFSAAIPGQGWNNGVHLNEQWPDYWADLFRQNGYEPIDCIRPKIWNNRRVCWWYAQNLLLFVKRDKCETYALLQDRATTPMALVHPRLYGQYADSDSISPYRKVWLIKKAVASIGRDIGKKLLR